MGFEAIGIVSQDLKKSVQFYSRLELEFREAGNPLHLEAATSTGMRIMLDSAELIKKIHPTWKHQPGIGLSLCFRQNSPEEVNLLFKKLIELGGTSVQEPWDAVWGHRYACLKDPDGNQIDLFADL